MCADHRLPRVSGSRTSSPAAFLHFTFAGQFAPGCIPRRAGRVLLRAGPRLARVWKAASLEVDQPLDSVSLPLDGRPQMACALVIDGVKLGDAHGLVHPAQWIS